QLATGNDTGSIRILDAKTGQRKAVFRGHTKRVTTLVFSPPILAFTRSPLLASAGQDKCVKLWDATTWEEIRQFPGFTAGALSPDTRVALAYGRGKVLVMYTQGEG